MIIFIILFLFDLDYLKKVINYTLKTFFIIKYYYSIF